MTRLDRFACRTRTVTPRLDGTDGVGRYGDGLGDGAGDTDDDNDGVLDGPDPLADRSIPDVCGDSDGDGCDDCATWARTTSDPER